MDQHPNKQIIMETDEGDDLVRRIRCLRHSKRPSLQMYNIWIVEHRHNSYTNEIECTLMHGLVATGIMNIPRSPNSYPLLGRHSAHIILQTSDRMQEYSIPSLGGNYVRAMPHRFPNVIAGQGEYDEIGIFPQVQEMYPHLGVLHYIINCSNPMLKMQIGNGYTLIYNL
jgi:hypothetical protein